MRLSRRGFVSAAGACLWASAYPARSATPPEGAIDVTQFGAVGDGETDDTAALQKAHAAGRPLYYPRAKHFYRITQRLPVTADVTGDEAEIHCHQDGNIDTAIFFVNLTRDPIAIAGMVLDGEYFGGDAGEHGHGIFLGAAENVTVRGNTIRNVYGDCVSVSEDKRRTGVCKNIVIENNRLERARRCNVAITGGDGVRIAGNSIYRPVTALPTYHTAIDLEPDRNDVSLARNVVIHDNTFDMEDKFLNLTKCNQTPTENVSIVGNVGRANVFLRINPSAKAGNIVVAKNVFAAPHPAGPAIVINGVDRLQISGNTDKTPCMAGYRTLDIQASRATMSDNLFCG